MANQAELLSSLPTPRFGNGFSVGSVARFGAEDYEKSPEIFLNVPQSDEDMWDINIVDTEGGEIIPVISCYGTRNVFHIAEQINHFSEDNTPEENFVQAMTDSVPTSLAIMFSPCAPPNEEGEVAYIEVKYKGLTARVEWQWESEDSNDIIVSDFEGKRLRVKWDNGNGKGITYHEA